MRILVIDDQHDAAELMARLLRAIGHETEVCIHGNEAMEMIERLQPEIVLLDLAMPMMNGLDVAEELQHNPDLRPQLLVAVTGFDSPEVRNEALSAGFDLYFAKPVELWRLQTLEVTARHKQRVS